MKAVFMLSESQGGDGETEYVVEVGDYAQLTYDVLREGIDGTGDIIAWYRHGFWVTLDGREWSDVTIIRGDDA